MEKHHTMPRTTVKGLKDQTAHSITNGTRSTMRLCVSAISGPEWDKLGGFTLYLAFPRANWKKYLLRWSGEHLLSLLSCSLPSWTCFCSAHYKETNTGWVCRRKSMYFIYGSPDLASVHICTLISTGQSTTICATVCVHNTEKSCPCWRPSHGFAQPQTCFTCFLLI